jgi:hypothetical protein
LQSALGVSYIAPPWDAANALNETLANEATTKIDRNLFMFKLAELKLAEVFNMEHH